MLAELTIFPDCSRCPRRIVMLLFVMQVSVYETINKKVRSAVCND